MIKTPVLATVALAAASLHAIPTDPGIYALFQTNKGDFAAELYYQQAPIAASNFIGLAEGEILIWDEDSGQPVSQPFYDGLIFHRVIDGFMIQGGDPAGNGSGGPGYAFPDEARPELGHDDAGILSMANSGANTNGSQFFITLDDQPHLDGKHTVFGKIVEGLDIVQSIGDVATNNQDKPVDNVVMQSVRILRIGENAEAFNAVRRVFPQSREARAGLALDDQGSPTVTVVGQQSRRYALRSSSDMVDWIDEAYLAGNLDASRSYQFDLFESLQPQDQQLFFSVSEILGHLSLNRNGGSFVITSPGGQTDYIENIVFEEDFTGVYTVPGSQGQGDTDFDMVYRYYNIDENRDQLWVVLQNLAVNNPYYQYFLTWETETSGKVYIRDAIYNFVGEGTFTYTPPQ